MIQVDIVTPNRKLVDGVSVKEVRLPGELGQLQVLPGHTELLTLLGTGVLAFHDESGRERKFAISQGFAEVRDDKVMVLAERAEESTDIDRNRAQKAKQNAEQQLNGTLSPEAFRKQQLKLERALTRIQVTN